MKAIGELEAALADGAHVELQRLDQLAALWGMPAVDQDVKAHIASLIDGERAAYLATRESLSPSDLPDADQIELARRCAAIIGRETSTEIPADRVTETAKQAAVIFGIKEAYIYRDWQAAIGDMMLLQDEGGPRHFSVLGFGTFEDMILETRRDKQLIRARWFDRLEGLLYDFDIAREGMFDARRDQIRKLYECCIKLENSLEERITAPDF